MPCIVAPALPRLLLGLILTAAMATGGWATGAAQPGDDAGMAAYLAAGGDRADLCGSAGRSLRHDHDVCGLCPPGISATLPPVGTTLRETGADPGAAAAPVRAALLAAPPRHPAWSGRAPPAV